MSGVLCVNHGDSEADSTPQAETGFLCSKCFSRLRSGLLELPAIATWLHVNLAAGGNPDGEKVSGSREDPIPLRVNVLDLIGPDSRHWVAADRPDFLLWADGTAVAAFDSWRTASAAWREAMTTAGVDPNVIELLIDVPVHDRLTAADDCTDDCPRCRLAELIDYDDVDAARNRWQVRPTDRGGCDQRGDEAIRAALFSWVTLTTEENPDFAWPEAATDITSLAGWLAGHLSWIAARPWVEELATDVHRLASGAHRLAPWREEIMTTKDPCSSCNVRAVVLHVARSTMVCEKRLGGCGKSWSSPYLKQATA